MQLYYAITSEGDTTYVTFIEQDLWDSRPNDMKLFNAKISNRIDIVSYIQSLNMEFLSISQELKGSGIFILIDEKINHTDFLKRGLVYSSSFEEFLRSL